MYDLIRVGIFDRSTNRVGFAKHQNHKLYNLYAFLAVKTDIPFQFIRKIEPDFEFYKMKFNLINPYI